MPASTLKRVIDRKQWAPCTPAPTVSAANQCVVESFMPDGGAIQLHATTGANWYDAREDSWVPMTSPALATFGAGACGAHTPIGPTGTALAGSTSTTLNTATAIRSPLKPGPDGRKYRVRITAGTGAGQERGILDNTSGTNAIVTVDSAWDVTPDATSVYLLLTGRWYFMGGGTTAAGSFKYWDHATQTWSGNLTVTGVPTLTAECRLLSTPGMRGSNGKSLGAGAFANTTTGFTTGTATAGAATTLTDANGGVVWATNQWANSQVRIVSGTGAGQVRSISSNTGTVLTVSSAWTINPTAGSVYCIEGNDNYLYLLGNAAVTLYRYDIAANTWSTLAPGVARGAVTGAGVWAEWISGVTGSDWTAPNAVRNGRRIYSGRGGGSNVVDYYDIASNSWTNAITYGKAGPVVFNTGASAVYDGDDFIYLLNPVASSVTWVYKLNVCDEVLQACAYLGVPQGAIVSGPRAWMASYDDGVGSPVNFLYYMHSTSAAVYRCLMV